jgi:hypothetical protein
MTIPQFTAGQVLTAAELNAMVDAINAGGAVKVQRFTTSGTWTVPAGVTYARATIQGGGGGIGTASSGAGGTSSVAFASGTVSAAGGFLINTAGTMAAGAAFAGLANTGRGAFLMSDTSQINTLASTADGVLAYAGAAVTPAASITVTVGAGGVAGTNGAAGGSGYVYIEYQGG